MIYKMNEFNQAALQTVATALHGVVDMNPEFTETIYETPYMDGALRFIAATFIKEELKVVSPIAIVFIFTSPDFDLLGVVTFDSSKASISEATDAVMGYVEQLYFETIREIVKERQNAGEFPIN
jgi:hypothetical protein